MAPVRSDNRNLSVVDAEEAASQLADFDQVFVLGFGQKCVLIKNGEPRGLAFIRCHEIPPQGLRDDANAVAVIRA